VAPNEMLTKFLTVLLVVLAVVIADVHAAQAEAKAGAARRSLRSSLHTRRRDGPAVNMQMPTLGVPVGSDDTGARFWIKGFIPGPGCTTSALDNSAYRTIGSTYTMCSSNAQAQDLAAGVTDRVVYPAPGVTLTREYFRTDDRCWSDSMTASSRIQVLCGIFKTRDSPAKYRITCGANAGITRHYYKQMQLRGEGCFELKCQARDGLHAFFTTPAFNAGTTYTISQLSISGSDPCINILGISIPAPPAQVDASQSTIKIDGTTVTIRILGRKTDFPAIESYFSGGTPAATVQLLRSPPTGPWHIATHSTLDSGVKTASCPRC